MKVYYIIFFVFFCVLINAQEITDKESFRRCSKEFKKSTCLSDEDKDGTLFYLDKCPRESGPVENKGCPWPDRDHDGVVDQEDACPEVAGPSENNGCPWPDSDGDGIVDRDDECPNHVGLPEYKGCPKPYRLDCEKKKKEDSLEMAKLRKDYKEIDKAYNQLSRNLLDQIKKYNFKNIQLHITLIDWGPSCHYGDGCSQSWEHNQANFLRSKFWNKEALDNLYSRKDIGEIYFVNKFWPALLPELKEFLDPSLYDYLMKYRIEGQERIVMTKKRKEPGKYIKVEIHFKDPYHLEIMLIGNSFMTDNQYEFDGEKWTVLKK